MFSFASFVLNDFKAPLVAQKINAGVSILPCGVDIVPVLALEVFENLGIVGVPIVAIAKGPKRNAGEERFFLPNRLPFSLDSSDPVLYFLQRLRDEAHRFAIGTHRNRRSKAVKHSPLNEIKGIGRIRKRSLLHHFGSLRGVSEAGAKDLEQVEGISRSMAIKIYDWFHSGD